MSGQVAPSNTSYIILPLEAAGIPPGSILLNPHTGQPFVNPDGTPAIYNPPSGQQTMRSQMVGQSQQQPSSQQPQQVQQPQQQMASHLVTQRDDMTAQFNQMSLSRQSSGDNPESPSGPVYPSPILQQPAQQTSYIMASPSQQLPPGGFTGSGPPVSQQVLQPPPPPQGFVQQPPPPAQMPVYYYPSGQYPTSTTQQYRPIASVQYSAQRSQQIPQTAQQAGYQSVLPNQQQGFQGLMGMQQPPQSQNLMNNQQGNQVQGMMVQYPAMSSYQVCLYSLASDMNSLSYDTLSVDIPKDEIHQGVVDIKNMEREVLASTFSTKSANLTHMEDITAGSSVAFSSNRVQTLLNKAYIASGRGSTTPSFLQHFSPSSDLFLFRANCPLRRVVSLVIAVFKVMIHKKLCTMPLLKVHPFKDVSPIQLSGSCQHIKMTLYSQSGFVINGINSQQSFAYVKGERVSQLAKIEKTLLIIHVTKCEGLHLASSTNARKCLIESRALPAVTELYNSLKITFMECGCESGKCNRITGEKGSVKLRFRPPEFNLRLALRLHTELPVPNVFRNKSNLARVCQTRTAVLAFDRRHGPIP
ncbi:hypothetical protein BTVI_89229 [Pitangus sulphuratus]|nr:hypothetical protein BTVI_89229 [Pitangus sulphuratus]